MSKQRKHGSRFAVVPGWIFDCAEFTATETLVFACLCLFANDKKMCFPSVAELARVSKLGNSTVRRDLSRLESKGAITKKNRFDSGGKTSNLYCLANVLPHSGTGRDETLPHSGGYSHNIAQPTLPRGYEQHQVTIPNEQGGDKNTVSLIMGAQNLAQNAPLGDFEELAKDIIINIERGSI